jgi:hypothetical protein
MEMAFKEEFVSLWEKYFNRSELPITFYYTDEADRADLVTPGSPPQCVIGGLVRVRQGSSLCFKAASVGCFGGRKYLGFSEKIVPDFEYFLSCGLPGKVEGERYKKSPEMVASIVKHWSGFKAPARFIVFKRWDNLEAVDEPAVVIFYARPDVLAGLYTLANFDEEDPNAVVAPMGSGCFSIVQGPYLEGVRERPHAVIGMFDPSARPFVAPDELTFAVPMRKFIGMVRNMEESFLITKSWKNIQKRI